MFRSAIGKTLPLIKTSDERLQCAICTYLLNGPLQFPCGHLVCTPCARKIKQDKYVVMFLRYNYVIYLFYAVLQFFTARSAMN